MGGSKPAGPQSIRKRVPINKSRCSLTIFPTDRFGIEDVIVVNRRDGAYTFERLQEKDFNVWLESYSVGELWSKNVISGGPVHE